jgi:glycosyltransferase involved in cell wall biosynthesis
MKLSFILPAHDEEALLGVTIHAVQEAGKAVGEPFEVIVVDDASSDASARIAEQAGARVVSVNLRQIAAARNAGAAVAQGDALFFVDADTIVTRDVVRAAVEALRAGAVGGGAAVRFDDPIPRYARLMLPVLVWFFRRLRLAGGGFLFCARDAFRAVGGFDPSVFAGEEVLLSRALGRQGRFTILEEPVVTSGRKLRSYRAREILGTLAKLALLGGRGVRDRSRLALWYGPRPQDPVSGTPAVRSCSRAAGDAGRRD